MLYVNSFAVRINNGLSIRPTVNLVSNLGFRKDATHTKSNNKNIQNTPDDITFPLKHPEFIIPYKIDDNKFSKKFLDDRLFSRILRKFHAIA